jgi:hypothetical protein
MEKITNDETKKKLLEQLRGAVCIQLALWSTCFAIEALLDDKCDAIASIYQFARNYAEKNIRDLRVEEILFGCEAKDSARATGNPKTVHSLAKLTKDARRKLVRATQNAIWLQNAFFNATEAIAQARNCDENIVNDFLSELTVEAYDSPEILQIHQKWFFGEIRTDSETDVDQTFTEPDQVGRTERSQVCKERKGISSKASKSVYVN